VQGEEDNSDLALVFERDRFEETEVADISIARVSEQDFSRIGLAKPRVVAVPEATRVPVTITTILPGRGGLQSVGELRLDKEVMGGLEFLGSTTNGFSGAAYHTGNTVFGIHRIGGVINGGYDAQFLSVCAMEYGEDTAEWLERCMRNRQGKFKFRRNVAADTVTVYDGYSYHTLDADTFDTLLDRLQEKYEREVYERDLRAAEMTDRDEESIERGLAERYERYARETRNEEARQTFIEKAAGRRGRVRQLEAARRGVEVEETLSEKVVSKLQPEMRARVKNAEANPYVDLPEEIAPEDDAKMPETLEVKILDATEAGMAIGRLANALNAKAAVLPDAENAALLPMVSEFDELTVALDDLTRTIKVRHAQLAEIYTKKTEQQQAAKLDGAPEDVRQKMAEMTTVAQASLENVKPLIKAANIAMTAAKAKHPKLSKAKKRVARSELCVKLIDSGFDPEETLRALVASKVLSSAVVQSALKSAGYNITPASAGGSEEEVDAATGFVVCPNPTSKPSSSKSPPNSDKEATKKVTFSRKLESKP